MKKRILALALCLVTAMSLLPVTAMADSWTDPNTGIGVQGIEPDGVYCGDTYFTVILRVGFRLFDVWGLTASDEKIPLHQEEDGSFLIPGNTQITKITYSVECGPTRPLTYYIPITVHDWHFTQTDGTLTAECPNKGCPIGKASLMLDARSVTLPESPFNARLEGLEQFIKGVPNADIGELVYKYKGSKDSEYRVVEPTAANAKAGQYQVGVRITIPGNDSQGDRVYDLFVQYTAADPAVRNNLPMILMIVAVAVLLSSPLSC